MKENNLILASGSPRRRELLSLYTTDFTVCVSDFDESAVTAPTPARLVEQLAIGKCLAVAKQHPDAVVIGCDTVVDVDGTVFGKPRDAEDAKRMLRALSGKTHQVHTGVCIAKGDRAEHFVDSCKVTFFPLGLCLNGFTLNSFCDKILWSISSSDNAEKSASLLHLSNSVEYFSTRESTYLRN